MKRRLEVYSTMKRYHVTRIHLKLSKDIPEALQSFLHRACNLRDDTLLDNRYRGLVLAPMFQVPCDSYHHRKMKQQLLLDLFGERTIPGAPMTYSAFVDQGDYWELTACSVGDPSPMQPIEQFLTGVHRYLMNTSEVDIPVVRHRSTNLRTELHWHPTGRCTSLTALSHTPIVETV